MNDIELLAHKISTIILVLNSYDKFQKLTADDLCIQTMGSCKYLHATKTFFDTYALQFKDKSYPEINNDIAALVSSNPISTTPLKKSTGFEGFLWVNTNDDFYMYQYVNESYDEDKVQVINPNDEALVFQKSLIHNKHQMQYLLLFSSLYYNPLIKGLKFHIHLEFVCAAYDILMQGYSYDI